jgi:hypothetical protein|tara:strand:- start:2518 stop:3393 length:876 start_codon:yes stop_codon:yes gene_type:complete
VKSFFKKIFKNKKKDIEKKYEDLIIPKIKDFRNTIITKETISFLHYGHLGDIVNSLPVIKELSKNKKCNLYIQKNKSIPRHVLSRDHPFGEVYLSESSILKILPLLKAQKFIQKVEIYNNQKIDIDLNFFREIPINFNIDSVRWYFHLTGNFPDLSNNYLEVPEHDKYKNYIVIMRSLRRQNKFIDYSFLSSYKNLVFIGLKDEFTNLKKKIENLEYYDSKDFLELASIIKNAKLFIGNLSFGYALAEAIKVPRLLESGPNFPLVYPNGPNAYDFYFQNHFEELVEKLHSI